MSVVKIYEKNETCGVCFAWETELSPIGDLLGEVFAMLLSESIIQITENYVENMMICQKCTMTLTSIWEFREKVISNMVMILGSCSDVNQEKSADSPMPLSEIVEPLSVEHNQENDAVIGNGCLQQELRTPTTIDKTNPPKDNVEFLIDADYDEVMFVEKSTEDETILLDDSDVKPFAGQILEDNKKMLLEWLGDDTNVKISGNDVNLADNDVKIAGNDEKIAGNDVKIAGNDDKIAGNDVKRSLHCEDCNHTYSSQDSYRTHLTMSSNHAVKQFVCDICHFAFRRKPELDGHVIYMHAGGGDYCPKCGKRCLPPYGLSRHLKRTCDPQKVVKKEVEIVACKVCNKKLKKHSFRQHMKYMHSKQRKVHCFECKKTFNNLKGYKTHKSTVKHHGGRQFVCDYCNRGFRTKANVEIHINSKHKSGAQICEHCKKTVRHDFNFHVKRCIRNRENTIKAEKSSKKLKDKINSKNKMSPAKSESLLVVRTQRKRNPSRKVIENAVVKSKIDSTSVKSVTKITTKPENTALPNVGNDSTNMVLLEIDKVEYLEDEYIL